MGQEYLLRVLNVNFATLYSKIVNSSYLDRQSSRTNSSLENSSSSCSSIVCFWTGTDIRVWLDWRLWQQPPKLQDSLSLIVFAFVSKCPGPQDPCNTPRESMARDYWAPQLWQFPWKLRNKIDQLITYLFIQVKWTIQIIL